MLRPRCARLASSEVVEIRSDAWCGVAVWAEAAIGSVGYGGVARLQPEPRGGTDGRREIAAIRVAGEGW